MNFKVQNGVYPTMVTPYQKSGEIDDKAVEKLVEWYWREGCDGIFAVCQSSEIRYLTLAERVALTRTVVRKARELAKRDPARAPMQIVASGHVSDRFEDQVEELNAIAAEGPDALILITNRMDIANTDDRAWIAETERLIARLPADLPIGVYECPKPYKRLLTPAMIAWCAQTGRFFFLKDTCCDAAIIRERLAIIRNSPLRLFNANAQTLLASVRDGAAGYCGVMANFHPALYGALLRAAKEDARKAELLQDFLGLAATIENLTYPCCAKYHLAEYEGVPMEILARSADAAQFTAYQQNCVDQLAQLAAHIRQNGI